MFTCALNTWLGLLLHIRIKKLCLLLVVCNNHIFYILNLGVSMCNEMNTMYLTDVEHQTYGICPVHRKGISGFCQLSMLKNKQKCT